MTGARTPRRPARGIHVLAARVVDARAAGAPGAPARLAEKARHFAHRCHGILHELLVLLACELQLVQLMKENTNHEDELHLQKR